jgi:hypothetical protein
MMDSADSIRTNAMNEDYAEPKQADDEIFINEISDEALEAAATNMEQFAFTFSIHPIYCRFC